MAEQPERPDQNGEEQEHRVDRGIAQVRGPGKPPVALAALVGALILVGGLWIVLGGEDARGPARPAAVESSAPALPPVLRPRPDPAPPPPVLVRPPPVAPGPVVDPLEERRAQLLIARIQELQRELDQRRRSKMLVVSYAAPAAPDAAAPGALPPTGGQGAASRPTASLPIPGIEPAGEAPAIQARMLPSTDYTITEGTVIPGVLETAINSDLPGMVRAVNAADVFSHDGTQLLIPKGSRLVGRYQSDIKRGQTRVFIVWNRILRADGLSVVITSPGTDQLGRAGLAGDVDTHFFKIFGAAILLSVIDGGLDVGVEMVRRQGAHSTTLIQNEGSLGRAGEVALQNSINIPPTIHVDQGARITILVARDLDFRAVELSRRE